MISYGDALAIIKELKLPGAEARVGLADAAGLRLAADVIALVPSPAFTNSAMDGYAVRFQDLRDLEQGAEGTQTPLPVLGTIYAGRLPETPLPDYRPGAAIRIMTGAWVPEWADTVIPVEQAVASSDGKHVRFTELPKAGANVRPQGDDMAKGTVALRAGSLLTSEHLMVAAALGHKELPVVLPPRVVVLSTGNELAEPEGPSEKDPTAPRTALAPGMIFNSCKYFLLSAAKQLLGSSVMHETLSDDPTAARRFVERLLTEDPHRRPLILVTTGAVSAGDLDFIPQVGAELGFKALFHKVAMRPGKPVYLAARDGTPKSVGAVWLGLPGNPVSTCVGWHYFARPLLTTLVGAPAATKQTLKLANEVRKPKGLRCFFRAEVSGSKAWVARRQGSADLSASATAQAYVELPEDLERLPADTQVEATIL
jgi:molybdopterin molybdotransferase